MNNIRRIEIIHENMENRDQLMVSIQCLVYNHEPYLRQCLDGIVMQKTNFRFEAIVHDDCSADGSRKIIEEYAAKYPDIIKPIYETENQYSKHDGSLRRIVYAQLQGKYIAICEGDDYWIDQNKLQKQVDVLEAEPDCSFCYTGFINVNENGQEIRRANYEHLMDVSHSGDILIDLLDGNFIMTCTTCFRRDVIMSELNAEVPCKYDYSLFLTASVLGKANYIPLKTAAYRKTSTGAMATQRDKIGDMFLRTQIYFYNGIASGRLLADKRRFTHKMKILIIKVCLYNDSKYQKKFRRVLWRNKSLWPYLPWTYFKRLVVSLIRKNKL